MPRCYCLTHPCVPACPAYDRTPVHTPEAHDAITAELVACTLGQRRHADRLELRVDTPGRIQHAIRTGVVHIAPTFDRLLAELRAYRYRPGAR